MTSNILNRLLRGRRSFDGSVRSQGGVVLSGGRAGVAIAAIASSLTGPVLAQIEGSKEVTAATAEVMRKVSASEPFADGEDYALAARGLIATFPEEGIKDAEGRIVRPFATKFFAGSAPPSVNPSLWRDAQLLAKPGLFKVTDRIYQVRGIDISNMSVIVGDTGYIVVDPLTSVDTARAALALVRKTLGERPVSGLIYTHSHIDHFGGAGGVLTAPEVAARHVPVLAPAGFMKEVISENVIAGPAMSRRIEYMSGAPLAVGPKGTISSGIGPSFTRNKDAPGTISLLPPTREIVKTGETLTVDGVRFEFQLTPGSEAPAEMNFYLPDLRALCGAENVNGSLHNILTPRGALVRSAKDWADYLTETLRLFGDRTDVLFTSHFWPRWQGDKVKDVLSSQRDMYKYLHDQSVRMMNNGLNGEEIGARIKLPDALARRWFNHPYYGTMSFNAHAVYQRYMGWYDGNPVHLNPIPPEDVGRRYVTAMGGAEKVRMLARQAFDAGDYQWASEILSRLVFADDRDTAARALLADCLEQLGYQAESAVWRNMYLSGAQDLRLDRPPPSRFQSFGGTQAALPLSDLLDTLAVRLDAERALRSPMRFVLSLKEERDKRVVEIRNGVLVHQQVSDASADPVVRIGRADFLALLGGKQAKVPADPRLRVFATLFETPQPAFGLVLPQP